MTRSTSIETLGNLPAQGAGVPHRAVAQWQLWLVLMTGSLLLRMVFYTGYFGSDEVTYTQAAFNLLHGNWNVSQYVGSNRYGINLPVAGLALLFGQNEFAAASYSMLCSVAEIALVFHFGQQMLGRKAGFLAAAILAVLPIHVHYAGRLMADAPLALAMTASFLLFWAGEVRNRSASFAWAGLAAGFAFWVKPHAMLYLMLFLAYPIIFRRWNRKWVWMLAGFFAGVLASIAFFWALTGRPLFLFEAHRASLTSGYLESGAASGSILDSALYYVVYLFGKIYHTWILAYLGLLAVALWIAGRQAAATPTAEPSVAGYLAWWSLGLVAVFSLFVVSWRPLLFIPQQVNYMLMFVAPLALSAGYALAQLDGRWLRATALLTFVPSIMLAGMQQNVVRVFTANSKATLDFARSHADDQIFVNTNAFRAAIFENLVRREAPIANVHFIGDLKNERSAIESARSAARRHAIIDTETLSWGKDEPITNIAAVPACWVPRGVLHPGDTGAGTRMLDAWRPVATLLPSGLRDGVIRKLDRLTRPAAAHVFDIPGDCVADHYPTVNRP